MPRRVAAVTSHRPALLVEVVALSGDLGVAVAGDALQQHDDSVDAAGDTSSTRGRRTLDAGPAIAFRIVERGVAQVLVALQAAHDQDVRTGPDGARQLARAR